MSLSSDLELLTEDMALDYDAASYVDVPATPPPPTAGNYRIKLNKFGLKKTKEGEIILWDGHKVLSLQQIEITEPFENARRVQIWQDVKTAPEPFQRDGKEVRQIIDLARSMDQTRSFSSVNAALAAIDQMAGEGLEPRVKLDWTAYDGDFVREQFEQAGGKGNLTREQINAVYKKAKLTNMFQFPKRADGKFNNIWTGVDGTKHIEAKATITRYYASLDQVKLGPAS